MKNNEDLTIKQEIFLQDLIDFISKKGYTSTIRELGQYVGLNSPATVYAYLGTLEEKGYIKRVNNRKIEVIKNGNNK